MVYYPRRKHNKSNWLVRYKDKEFLVATRHHVAGKFIKWKEFPLELWHWEMGRWTFVARQTPSDFCPCGKEYNGWKFKETKTMGSSTDESLIDFCNRPYLCKECYYRTEYKRGRWVPRDLHKQFESE